MNTNPAIFYIVRHGETVWNIEGRMQGHRDSPLTEEGISQAKKLGQELANIHFDHVLSSDLLRAKRTAELITLEKKLAVNTTHLLRERTFGAYEGARREEFQKSNESLIAQYEKLSRDKKWKFKYADDIESNEELIGRLIPLLRETAVTYPGKTILIVTHGGVLRVLLRHLGKGAAERPGTIKNTAHVKLLGDGVEFEVVETQGITFEAA